MKWFILFQMQWHNEQSSTKESESCLFPSLPEVAQSVHDASEPLHNAMCSKRLLQTFPMDTVPCSGFHKPLLFSAHCLIRIFLDHRQTHPPVLSPSFCTGPESPLQSILPAGHCETGAMQQKPGVYCVKWRDIFIWGKTRFSLLTKLVKSETWHFGLLQRLLKYKVC